MSEPKTLQQAIQYFSSAENCRDFVASLRWPNGVACPTCGRADVRYLETQGKWQCKSVHHHRQFSVKVGTIFEDSPIPLSKWLTAVWMITNCKNGVSSYEIHRAIGVTQKSAWFMMHRIRLAMRSNSFLKLGGHGKEVEVDEAFIGGRARNMHNEVRKRRMVTQFDKGKTPVLGMLERGGDVKAMVISSRKKRELQSEVREHVAAESALYTDRLQSYEGLIRDYAHYVIDHAVAYVDGRVHTNSLENFWSLLKRGLKGTYVSVEPFHLFRYLDEQVFRYNYRARKHNFIGDGDRFKTVMSRIMGKRLTFAELTGKVGETKN